MEGELKKGYVGRMVWEFGGRLLAHPLDVARVKNISGKHKRSTSSRCWNKLREWACRWA